MATTDTRPAGPSQAVSGDAGRGIRQVDARTVKSWIDAGEAVLVDVRESDEHARERIPGAKLSPLSKFDPGTHPEGQPRIVLHCKSGRRSADAATRLLNSGHCEAFSLTGGIEAWKAAGLGTQEDRSAPAMSLMRQVQLTIGLMLLLGTALAYAVSPWFLIVTGFIGAGQVVAGATGTCGLASLLSVLPWNRVSRRN